MARKTQNVFIALLRGINVSGQHKIPMSELRELCSSLGCNDVQTYIQSGNVVFTGTSSPNELEKRLEQAVEESFGFFVPIVVRSAGDWQSYVKSNPFGGKAEGEAKWVLLAVSKKPPKAGAATELEKRATLGEHVVQGKDVIWIHYANGIGKSKLSPAVIDRCIGSPATARNWRTVLKLDEMARELAAK
jgi:uncharacterized protein (DUF1697 family)